MIQTMTSSNQQSDPAHCPHTRINNPGGALLASALYTALWGTALLVSAPFLAARFIAHCQEMRERLSIWPQLRPVAGPVWIHASSLGETRGVLPLVSALSNMGLSPGLSVVTPAARGLADELSAAGATSVNFAPFDFTPLIQNILNHHRPQALLVCETEIWPALLYQTLKQNIPVAFINARLTQKSINHLRPLKPWLGNLLSGVHVAAQSEIDCERWRALGVPEEHSRVTGNTKYEPLPSLYSSDEISRIRKGWKHVVVFGSVRSSDVSAVTTAISVLSSQSPDTLIVVVPRHLNLADRLGRELSGHVSRVFERSSVSPHLFLECDQNKSIHKSDPGSNRDMKNGKSRESGKPSLLLVKTIGELRNYFSLADLCFVGGTFGNTGGHNLYEPASAGTPVFFGPSLTNVGSVAETLSNSGAGFRVIDGAGMGQQMTALLACPEKVAMATEMAKKAAVVLGGAVPRTIEALTDWSFPLSRGSREDTV